MIDSRVPGAICAECKIIGPIGAFPLSGSAAEGDGSLNMLNICHRRGGPGVKQTADRGVIVRAPGTR